MRRIVVVLVLGLVTGIWPAARGVAHGSTLAQAGPAGSLQADFNNDGVDDLAVGVPLDTVGAAVGAGAVNVLYGSVTGLGGTGSQLLSQATPGVPGSAETDDGFGSALAAGDFNNDTFADLAVGAPGESVGPAVAAGAVSVLYGSASGLTGTGSQQFTQVGGAVEAGDQFGSALAVGDFDADAFADLAAGAPSEGAFGTPSAGAVSVLPGSSGGLTTVGGQIFTQVGSAAEAGDQFGFAVAAGDFNNDGFADLAAGAPFEDAFSTSDAGAVSVLPGSSAGLTTTGGQIFTQVGSAAETGDVFGFEVAAGDFDNDGFADLAAGAPFEDAFSIADAGAVSVLPGSSGGLTTAGGQIFTQDSPGVPGGAEAFDGFGYTLATGDPGAATAAASPSGSGSRAQSTAPSR
jgi:FG-GAP repeat